MAQFIPSASALFASAANPASLARTSILPPVSSLVAEASVLALPHHIGPITIMAAAFFGIGIVCLIIGVAMHRRDRE